MSKPSEGGNNLGDIPTQTPARYRSRRGPTGVPDYSHMVKDIGKGCAKAGVDNCDLCIFDDCEYSEEGRGKR